MTDLKRLLQKCEEVLDKNWNGSFTIPSATLYPHQWSWDAAFIALGNSYTHTERTIKEMQFLFDAQWKNCMVPHIVFNEKKNIFSCSRFLRNYSFTKCPRTYRHIRNDTTTRARSFMLLYTSELRT